MMNLGSKIKSLRIKKNLTQEQLADYLSVSVQTISRWETSVNYPDVIMLPVLANIFDVTTDYLLEVDIGKNREAIKKIKEKIQKLQNFGNLDEAIVILRDALKRFPNNFELLLTLSEILIIHQEKKPENLKEASNISMRVLENSTKEKYRKQAINNLFFAYLNLGDKKRMREIYDNYIANEENNSFDNCAHYVLEGNELVDYIQDNLINKYYNLWHDLIGLQKSKLYTTEEKIMNLDKFNKITKIFFESNDLGYFNWLVLNINHKIAFHCANLKNQELTLKYLEKAAYHAIEADTRPEEIHSTSILLNRTKDFKKDITTNGKGNWSYVLLNNLAENNFDFIKNDRKFIDLKMKLTQHAIKY